SEWANTRKPAQVLRPPTQRPSGRTAWNMIRHSGLFVKGGFCRCVPVVVLHEEAPLLALCRHCPAQRFCFSPNPGGASPLGGCGEERPYKGARDMDAETQTQAQTLAPRLKANLDTNFLKLVAILCMVVDHVGTVF